VPFLLGFPWDAVEGGSGKRYNFKLVAAVAQLVERNLAKVEVESSRLFCRSSFAGEAALKRFPPFRIRPIRSCWAPPLGRGGRVVMQRPAKPCTPVRFRPPPPNLP